jgi:predicted ATP-dependent serine protease
VTAPTSGVAPARRYICPRPTCGRVHASWYARCWSCGELGLVRVDDEPVRIAHPVAHPVAHPMTAHPVAQPMIAHPVAHPMTASPFVAPTSTPPPTPPEPPATEQLPDPPSQAPILRLVPPAPEPTLEPDELVDEDPPDEDEPIPLSEVPETAYARDSTGLPPLDHVLGGGLVVAPPAVVLLASPPGIGKTSLTLQMLDGLGHRCLYVTGEETREQVAATARRIGVASSKIYVVVASDLKKIFAKAEAKRIQTIAIDSIQKMRCEGVSGRPGSPTQIKECTARLVQYAKTTGTVLWLIGHVTADGDIAGPKTIEHDVDVVLEMEKGPKFEGNERIIRCPGKNRFGQTNEKTVGRFELTDRGFVGVDADGWDEEL